MGIPKSVFSGDLNNVGWFDTDVLPLGVFDEELGTLDKYATVTAQVVITALQPQPYKARVTSAVGQIIVVSTTEGSAIAVLNRRRAILIT